MLKITRSNTVTEERWILCGQLTGPWVAQLVSDWERIQTASGNRKCVVDLREVTFIDERGAELLREMRNRGAEFIASGVDTKHVVENLNTRERRPLRKFLLHLDDGCVRSRKDKQQGE
jgi:anti-anti-sigma regulatory factor